MGCEGNVTIESKCATNVIYFELNPFVYLQINNNR